MDAIARLLIVDDEEQVRALYSDLLQDRGYEVSAEATLAGGLRALDRDDPDLVIVDLNLPDGSGLEIARAAARRLPPVPTLIASGVADEEALLEGYEAGALDYMVKPFPNALLLTKIEVHLTRRRATSPAGCVLPGGHERAFGRYRVEGSLGRGSQGVVLRAHDLQGGGPVALKVLQPRAGLDQEERTRESRRFSREAYTLASVQHPHVVRLLDQGSQHGLSYFTMELLAGEDLYARVQRHGPLSEPAVRELLRGLASALDAVHTQGLVHRDLKPGNVILRKGNPRDPVLVDFGLAKLPFDRSLTARAEVHGTPAYMAPEVIAGQQASPRSDLFSLGLVGCFAASGERAFPGLDLVALLQALRTRPVRIPTGLSEPLRAVLRRLTRIDPASRYASGAELAAALDAPPP
ncbi:MAG: protein kinase [Planctomycetota bacterium]